ncbi:putative Transporter [Seiridium cardinale]
MDGTPWGQSPPGSGTMSARRLKKREQDRLAQRAARGRTKQRISELEATVAELSHAGPGQSTGRLREQLATVTKEKNGLVQTLNAIQNLIQARCSGDSVLHDDSSHHAPRPPSAPLSGPSIGLSNAVDGSASNESAIDDNGYPTLPTTELLSPTSPILDVASQAAMMMPVALLGDIDITGQLSGEPRVPSPGTCDCSYSDPIDTGNNSSQPRSLWRSSNDFLKGSRKVPSNELTQADQQADDIPVRVLLEGWDAIAKSGQLSPLWAKLREIDELQFSNCGDVERLAILRMMHSLLKFHVEPTLDHCTNLPQWYLELPSQGLPHSYATDFFVCRRIDRRLLPILGIMYSISLIDRTNLGLALVAGMQEDLGLGVANRYTIVVMLFFVTYIVFEIPSNLILPRVGPANWLAFLGVSFGAILIGMGFTKSWETMALCRALLGVVEAGFLPGCTYLITCWYTRFEVGKRISGFWILSVLASAFSAIFAYVLTLLSGKAGLRGWSWIFIIEGIITCLVCFAGRFIIINFPSQANHFLKSEEQAHIIARIDRDRGDAVEDEVTFTKIVHHLKDWRLYVWAFNLMASTLPGYAYSYFLPIILRSGMGFSTTNSQLLSAPPYILAAIITYISGWLGDRFHVRGPIIGVHQLLTAIGMLLTAYGGSNAVRYFGAFLGIGFVQYCIPGVLTFQANNITQHSKRAVATCVCITGGGFGGIIASLVFISRESPNYTTGVFTTLGISLASIVLIAGLDIYLWMCNKKLKAGTHQNEGIEGWLYTI